MIVYLKSHRRRPVRIGNVWQSLDRQAAIPAGWCVDCGREVFLPEKERCPDCERKER